MQRYKPKEIEARWQQKWEADKIYHATDDPAKPKKYILEYFPYPSGAAMHVGHVRNYTIGDVLARYYRMQGFNVLHPMGWDAFGLPAENFAIKNQISPRVAIEQNTRRFKEQLIQMGFSYDWSREIDSTDPDYYKWTQWFFLLLWRRGLAYQKESPQWWCPVDKTVLANEQVEAGLCWRCGSQVEKKALNQWFFKITDYADRLEKDLDDIDWSDGIKNMQRNWIGHSKGAEVEFVVGSQAYTTKDTLKFTPEMTRLIQSGDKSVTICKDSKDVSVGDYVKLQTRFDARSVSSFAVAQIKSVETMKLGDIANDYPGHNAYLSDDEKLQAQREHYGPDISLDTSFTIYEFEKVADIITVFTTRPDTLYGATFMVLSPEHPLLDTITTQEQLDAVSQYIKAAQAKSDIERQETNRDKTGVFTGAYATNPVNNQQIPVWTADYVLMGYGTGAIMAVPAHDERDNEFAKKFNLPVQEVVSELLIFDDYNAAREEVETHERKVVDAIIVNQEGKYLLQTDERNTHFVGGGIEAQDSDIEVAIRREVAEEVGITQIQSIQEASATITAYGYRIPKNINQRTEGKFYEVVVDSSETIPSEIDTGKHTVEWVDKDDVAPRITWIHHARGWEQYVNGNVCYHGEGLLINSGDYSGLPTSEAREKIVADLEARGVGKEVVNYKIRDWLISRQRYWGAPIPMIHCPKDGIVPVPEDQLPVRLPDLEKFEPSGDGRSPLANDPGFLHTTCPQCDGPAERETDTMDGFACSSWYFLRFADPHNNDRAFDADKAKYWLPVDDYIGGAEHAVMHLLYARMWTKVMHDAGLVDFDEPFTKLRNQGMILAPDGQKMSKSKGNTIEPGLLIDQGYGADSIRIMELFIGPWNQTANWSVEGMGGAFRFLQRVWTLTQEYKDTKTSDGDISDELNRAVHKAIKKITEDMAALSFNTSIATLMEVTNELFRIKATDGYASSNWNENLQKVVQLLAPFAPHIAEEIWQQLDIKTSVHMSKWPEYDEKYLVSDTITIVVQVNGKVRANIEVASGADEASILAAAQADEKTKVYLDGKEIRKTVYVPGKLVSFVV